MIVIYYRKIKQKKSTFFWNFFFDKKKMDFFDGIFSKFNSWSRRIVLQRFQSDSDSLKVRKIKMEKNVFFLHYLTSIFGKLYHLCEWTLKSSDPKSSESDYLSQWLLKSLGNFPDVPSKTWFFNTYFWFFNVFVHFLVEKSEWLLKSFFRTSPNRPSDYLSHRLLKSLKSVYCAHFKIASI